jgi:NAD(P)-binding Rossmann-like domain
MKHKCLPLRLLVPVRIDWMLTAMILLLRYELRHHRTKSFYGDALIVGSSCSSTSIRTMRRSLKLSVYDRSVQISSIAHNNADEGMQPPIKQSIAIIGGGIAGLACAHRLSLDSRYSYDVTVYDTGRLRPGGRCSSRRINDVPKLSQQQQHQNNDRYNREESESEGAEEEETFRRQSSPSLLKPSRQTSLLSNYMYDHAAQVVSRPTHPRYQPFCQQLDEWEHNGILQRFRNNTLYNIWSFKKIEPINNVTFYYGTNTGGGIGGISTSIVQNGSFTLKQNMWIPPRNGIQYMIHQNKWKVVEQKFTRPQLYDNLIVAHNGKCAFQLVQNIPSVEISKLMKVQFQDKVPACGGPCMTLNSIYSLTFAIPSTKENVLTQHLPNTFLAGYVKNHPALRFITCQTRKYGYGTNNKNDTSIDVWTVLSSGAFGLKYKASQENLSPSVIQRVTRLLMSAVEEALTGTLVKTIVNEKQDDDEDDDNKPQERPLPPPSRLEQLCIDQHLQLWGAGVPMNVWEIERGRTPAEYLYDAQYRVGVCGDWLMEASIAGAWTSGHALAKHIMNNKTKESHGLKKGSFRRSVATAKAGIGLLQA